MRLKELLQCDTSAMSFASAFLRSDEDRRIKKNSKVGNDFSHFSRDYLKSEAFSGNGEQQRSDEKS